MQGRIKKLVLDRGFGFIQYEGGGDVFFHRSGVLDVDFDALSEGQDVTFEIEESGKGPRARDVRVVS